MTRFLDDRCLANFVAIYEHGNIRRAAEKVHLTQPAMSKSLSRLEDNLNVLLFVRRNRGLTPTQAAHELYECARKIETETRRSLVRIAGFDRGLRGRFRIGAGQMWSWLRIPGVIHEFMSEFPNLDVELRSAPMEVLVEHLENGQIDIAVGDMADVQVPQGCREFAFKPGIQWPFVSEGHPLASRTDTRLSDLVKFPWIGFVNDSVFTRNVATACENAGVMMPAMPFKANSLAAIMALVRKGSYVAVLPDDFKHTARTFGLSRIESKVLKMWSLSTAALYYEDDYKIDPLQVLVTMMREANMELGST